MNPIISVNHAGMAFSNGGTGTLSAYVCTPDRKIKCRVRGISEFSVAAKGFNDFSSISFTVNKNIINQSTYMLDVNEAYDYLHAFCLIFIPEFGDYGYFLINSEPEINARGRNDESKSFTAESYESILQYENLVDFSVNQGTASSLEMFEDNLDALGIPQRNICLYDPENPQYSLLNLVLTDDYYGWEIGEVDDGIQMLERSFEVSSQNLYSFLCYDVSKAFQCIFTFDTVNLLINCYSIKTVGQNTNIYLSLDHFLSEVDISPQTDNIATVFKVKGGNNLGIEVVNFGSDKIVNIDYPLKILNNDLAEKYSQYKEDREQSRALYTDCMEEYYEELQKEQAILDRQPDDAISNNWTSTIYYPSEDLEDYLNVYTQAVEIIEDLYRDEATGVVDMAKLNSSDNAALYHSYKDVCIPDIQGELKRRRQGTPYTPVDSDVIWELYGLNDLQTKLSNYQTLCDTLREQGYAANSWDPSSTISQDTYNAHHQEYLTYQQYIAQLNTLIASKTAEVEASRATQEDLLEQMETLANNASMESYIGTIFTEDDVQTIHSLYREADYQNENILLTEVDDLVSEVAKANQLYLDSQDRLEIESVPQLSWSVSSGNLFAMKEFESLRSQLQIGSFVNLYYGGQLYDPTSGEFADNQTLKFRITEIDFDGINFDGGFQLVFSNMTATKMFRNDYENILNTMISSRTNSIVNSATGAANATATNVATTLIRPYIEMLTAKLEKMQIDRSDVLNLYAFSGEVENLVADYLTSHVADIFHLYVDVIESDDGNSWWNLRTGDLCLNGYLINTEVEYAAGTLNDAPTTGWSPQMPVLTPDKPYTWMRTIMTLDGNPPTTTTSNPARITGEDGHDGESIYILSQSVMYKLSISGTTHDEVYLASEGDAYFITEDGIQIGVEENNDWSYQIPEPVPGMYLWTRTTTTYSDHSIVTSYSVSVSGRGVDHTVTYHYLSSSEYRLLDGEWTTTVPEYIVGRYYWVKTETFYTDGTSEISTPIIDVELNNSEYIKDLVEGTQKHFFVDNEGAHITIGNNTPNEGANLFMDNEGLMFRDDTSVVSRFSRDDILLGDVDSSHVHITAGKTIFTNDDAEIVAEISNDGGYSDTSGDYEFSYTVDHLSFAAGESFTATISFQDEYYMESGSYVPYFDVMLGYVKIYNTYDRNVYKLEELYFSFAANNTTVNDRRAMMSAHIERTTVDEESKLYTITLTFTAIAAVDFNTLELTGDLIYNVSTPSSYHVFSPHSATNEYGRDSFSAGTSHAFGDYSVAIGRSSYAYGKNDVVIGDGLYTDVDGQIVLGKNNKYTDNSNNVLVIGNGAEFGMNSNLLSLDKDGNILINDVATLSSLGTQIVRNTSLDAYIEAGNYYSPNATTSATLTHAPFTNTAFQMIVFKWGVGSSMRMQIAWQNNINTIIKYRVCNSGGTFGDWLSIAKVSDLSSYVTTTSLNSTLSAYAKTSALSSYVTTSSMNSTLSSYVKTATMNSTLSSYAKTSALSSYAKVATPTFTASSAFTFVRGAYYKVGRVVAFMCVLQNKSALTSGTTYDIGNFNYNASISGGVFGRSGRSVLQDVYMAGGTSTLRMNSTAAVAAGTQLDVSGIYIATS